MPWAERFQKTWHQVNVLGMECGNGFTGKVEWAGWDILQMGGWWGVICWWDTGRVYYWVEYVIGIMGGAICDLQWKQVGKGDNSDLYLLCNFC